MTALLHATDAHFAWLLGEAEAPDGLRLPPGPGEDPVIYRWLRGNLARIGQPSNWLIVMGGEVVGGCSYKTPPTPEGDVEIGYGVRESRRRLGHATRAVAALLEAARADTRVRCVVAETALANLPSQRVLELNGFHRAGHGHDADEGETIVWRLPL